MIDLDGNLAAPDGPEMLSGPYSKQREGCLDHKTETTHYKCIDHKPMVQSRYWDIEKEHPSVRRKQMHSPRCLRFGRLCKRRAFRSRFPVHIEQSQHRHG